MEVDSGDEVLMSRVWRLTRRIGNEFKEKDNSKRVGKAEGVHGGGLLDEKFEESYRWRIRIKETRSILELGSRSYKKHAMPTSRDLLSATPVTLSRLSNRASQKTLIFLKGVLSQNIKYLCKTECRYVPLNMGSETS